MQVSGVRCQVSGFGFRSCYFVDNDFDLEVSMPNTFINPDGISAPNGYTHVVTTTGHRTIYISGQVAFDRSGQIVGAGDLRAQTVQAFENLRMALAAAGATLNDIVKMTTFIVNYKPEYRPMLREARLNYLNAARPPAHTLVGVQALALPEIMIEIEATAVLD